jgi:cytidyltransferase-like protein
MVKIMVAGYFDPPHLGHYQMFNYAKLYVPDSYVIVVIHNVEDTIRKSGFYIYTTDELKWILMEHPSVDDVIVSLDDDSTVSKTIESIKPKFFVKGPDRSKNNMPESELKACEKVSCEIVYQDSCLKIHNSSSIKERIKNQILKI